MKNHVIGVNNASVLLLLKVDNYLKSLYNIDIHLNQLMEVKND